MAENTMPAAEATHAAPYDERARYEFAFHILPTVAEGEVPTVFEKLKAYITKEGGECFDEEMAQRVDLVYPVVKHLEGKNRRFNSAYFGWIRFAMMGESLHLLEEELTHETALLRTLIIKLTREEELHPFKFHEHHKAVKMVEVVDEEPEVLKETPTETEERKEVSEEALEESLEKITSEGEGGLA